MSGYRTKDRIHIQSLFSNPCYFAQASPSVELPVVIVRVTFQPPRSISDTVPSPCMQDT